MTLRSADGPATSAAVTRLSLVHRTRVPAAGPDGLEFTWVYLKRAAPADGPPRRGATPKSLSRKAD